MRPSALTIGIQWKHKHPGLDQVSCKDSSDLRKEILNYLNEINKVSHTSLFGNGKRAGLELRVDEYTFSLTASWRIRHRLINVMKSLRQKLQENDRICPFVYYLWMDTGVFDHEPMSKLSKKTGIQLIHPWSEDSDTMFMNFAFQFEGKNVEIELSDFDGKYFLIFIYETLNPNFEEDIKWLLTLSKKKR